MTKQPRTAKMSADAYAGFLRLLLSPAGAVPRQAEHAAEVAAYLRWASEREPLSAAARQALGQPTEQAA